MRITNIAINNFRNYEYINLNFNNNLNIFVGNNAQGKTNLLESIYVLGITKSHRVYIDKNLISDGEIYTKIKGNVKKENEELNLEILINAKGKSVKINNSIVRKVSEYISNFTVIIFCPDDLDIIKGSPSTRRKLLNIEIGQIDNKYLMYLNDYAGLLKTRNEYLKKSTFDNIDNNYIEVINEQLIEKAINIYKKRKEFVSLINIEASKIYRQLSRSNNLTIKYNTNIDLEDFTDEEIRKKMKSKFNSNLKREILFGTTIHGPHRDDILFNINDKDIREYGSQGQQRLAILSLKLGEVNIFKNITNEYPILLLDDVFNELD